MLANKQRKIASSTLNERLRATARQLRLIHFMGVEIKSATHSLYHSLFIRLSSGKSSSSSSSSWFRASSKSTSSSFLLALDLDTNHWVGYRVFALVRTHSISGLNRWIINSTFWVPNSYPSSIMKMEIQLNSSQVVVASPLDSSRRAARQLTTPSDPLSPDPWEEATNSPSWDHWNQTDYITHSPLHHQNEPTMMMSRWIRVWEWHFFIQKTLTLSLTMRNSISSMMNFLARPH